MRQEGSDENLAKVVKYMQAHWPSQVKAEWQVGLEEYAPIVQKAVRDLGKGATKGRQMVRVAGISGSGKTTQVLPAVEAYAQERKMRPVLMAARRFVEYHPHYQEILEFYGAENLRKMTDEFVTIMLFMTLARMIEEGYDIVLDVTLLDPEIEGLLLKFLQKAKYQLMILMVAVSPAVTEKFLAGREWRHTKETEQEFIRATEQALKFYAEAAPETRLVVWSVYRLEPEYDGAVKEGVEKFLELSQREEMPKDDHEARKKAKIEYLRQIAEGSD